MSERKIPIREWDYDDSGLEVIIDRSLSIRQFDGHGEMSLRIFDAHHARRLAQAVLLRRERLKSPRSHRDQSRALLGETKGDTMTDLLPHGWTLLAFGLSLAALVLTLGWLWLDERRSQARLNRILDRLDPYHY